MSQRLPRRIPAICLLALLIVPAAAFAQTSGAVLTGTVSDASGGSLPGVTVTATNVGTGVSRSVVTGADGSYRTPTLTPGRYNITVELSGFGTVNVPNVDLNVATTRDLDITMRPAAMQESITVSVDAPLVATTPSIGTVVSQRELENLPLNGRQFANLASLAPGTSLGVNPDPTKPGQLVVALNGGIGRNVNYTVDGGDNTDDTIGGALQNFNIEAVQEFSIQTQQYKAEYGRSTGGVLTVVTKTGTNDFGGSVYGFFRDKGFNSKTVSEENANRGKQAYERQQYGASFGGPIVRDRAHFFLTYEKTDRTTGFSLSPFVTAIFPGVSPTLAVDFEDELVSGKATWAISSTQQIQARYGSQQYSDVYNAQALSTPDNVGVLNSEFFSILTGHTAQFGSSVVNDFLYQYSSFENSILPVTDAPTQVFANGVNTGQNFNTPQTTEQIKHQFKNDLGFTSTLFGTRHDFKAGVNWVHEPTLGGSFSSGLGGRYTYAGNTADSPIREIFFNSGASRFSIPVDQYSFYLQDDWQITNRLVFNAGLRYDLWKGFEDINQSSSSLWQTLRNQTQYTEGYLLDFKRGSGQVEDDTNNWGPRLGFTFDITGDARQLIRGGWGLYYDFPYTNATLLFPTIPIQSNFGTSYSHANPNGIRNPDGSLYRIGQPLPPNQLTNPGTGVPNDVASPTIAAPESTQASLGYSWQVTNNVGLTVDLVNIEYKNIPFRFRANARVDTNGNGRIDTGEPLRFPQFGNFRIWYGDGQADYQGANLGLRARVTDRLEMQGFYTWSKAEGNVLSGADEFRLTNVLHQPELGAVADQLVNPFDPDGDQNTGPLNTDARHRLTFSVLYQAPWAINVGAIARYRSALPYTEWTGSDIDGDGFAFDLPVGVDEVNNLRGAAQKQVDLRLSREFRFGGIGVELLGEMFNIFNFENAHRFVGNRAASNFGQAQVFAGDPLQPEQRLLQLGVRLRY